MTGIKLTEEDKGGQEKCAESDYRMGSSARRHRNRATSSWIAALQRPVRELFHLFLGCERRRNQSL